MPTIADDTDALNDDWTTIATVRLTPEALQQSDKLPSVFHGRVLKLVERLRKCPNVSGAKPLTGRLSGRYRMRTGDYRILFTVEGDTVIIEKIGHRDGFYD